MLEENKYKFSNEENFNEVYNIAKIQFKKIINNFNEFDFKDNFGEIFYNTDNYYQLYLRKNDLILCGNLSYIFEDCAITDIYFWNDISFSRNNEEVRFFHEKFFKETSLLGINNTIMPLDKSRFKHEVFKKYCQKIFFSNTEYKTDDPLINKEYKNHYLLKVNHKNYFKKAEEAKVRILHE
jgi:hypothetical protein